QCAHVVLVAVGQHARLDPVGVVPQPAEVRQHQVDTGHRQVREHQPAVDDQDPTVDLQTRTVAPDLTEPTQEGEPDRVSHAGPSATQQPRLPTTPAPGP